MSAPSNTPHAGAVSADAYLTVVGAKQGQIKGESDTPDHVNDIAVLAWRWGVKSANSLGSSMATGRRIYQVLQVDKQVDSSSTALISALACNEVIKSATLSLRKAGTDGGTFLRIKLEMARVTSAEIQSSPSGGVHETIEFTYTKIEIEYHKQDKSGKLGGGMVFNDEILAS